MFLEGCAQNAGLTDESLLQLIGAKMEKQRVPLNVHLELTYRCNEQCVHCYCVVEHGREHEAATRELSTVEVTTLLDDLADMGAFYLTLTGGEVLVRRDFFEIAQHARDRGFVFRIFTNGIGLTEERVKRIAALEPLTVELSIFSADPAVHDSVTRVPGSHRRLLANIERLKAHGVRVYLKTTVMKPTLAGLPKLRQLGKALGVATHVFSCEVSPRIDGDIHGPAQHQLSEEELFQYFADPTIDYDPTPLFDDGSPEEVARQRMSCAPAVNGCCVDPYGNVFPCVAFRIPIGNIRERPFKELWHAPPPPIRELLAVQTYADLPECRSCELVGFCKRCHGDNLLARDDGDWKACQERARTVARAEQRLYRIREKDDGGLS